MSYQASCCWEYCFPLKINIYNGYLVIIVHLVTIKDSCSECDELTSLYLSFMNCLSCALSGSESRKTMLGWTFMLLQPFQMRTRSTRFYLFYNKSPFPLFLLMYMNLRIIGKWNWKGIHEFIWSNLLLKVKSFLTKNPSQVSVPPALENVQE